ncbi:Abi-alpha family protein [Staphylococcus aureus]
MFAKLIASSMDDRKNSLTHHSFVEIIKQLSPNDAILLKRKESRKYMLPLNITSAVLNPKNDGMNISDTLIKDSPLDIESTEISINNLVRLGVLK